MSAMDDDNDCVLDLSTTSRQRASPFTEEEYIVKVEPRSPPPSGSESDSGHDTVDSTRTSIDEPRLGSPSTSSFSPVVSGLDLDKQSLPPLPPILYIPQPSDSKSDGFHGSLPTIGHVNLNFDPLVMGNVREDLLRASQSFSQKLGEKRPGSSEIRPTTAAQSKRTHSAPVPTDKKDATYWERRRRNNDAAKRSRDMRRRKEEEIAMRAAVLEQENLKLRAQIALLKNETARLYYLLCNRG